MNVLVIGSGGREHALCYALNQSQQFEKCYCLPGNDGIEQHATCIQEDPYDFESIIEIVKQKHIDLVVVGPEGPLDAGITDALQAHDILVFGPSKAASRLESSKKFMKDICSAHHIPTAKYKSFMDPEAAIDYMRENPFPQVIKADGLAAGKGVIIAHDEKEALKAIQKIMIDKEFGLSGETIIIEEFLEGPELSFFALLDGNGHVVPFGAVQDHKKIGEGETGLNTGGMGAYMPVPFFTPELTKIVMDQIIMPIEEALRQKNTPFCGVLFAGLVLTKEGPKLLEFNVRLGDPEAQVILPLLESDAGDLLLKTAQGRLNEVTLSWSQKAIMGVVMAAKGYPQAYEKMTRIKGLDDLVGLEDIHVFHAGTVFKDNQWYANGGRVLCIVGKGRDMTTVKQKVYEAIDKIDWQQGYYRRDIGFQMVKAA